MTITLAVNMICELSELIGLEVYTDKAVFLGTVDNAVLSLDKKKVYGLYVSQTNPIMVEESRGVLIPFRWIRELGDIVLLSYFPGYVKLSDMKEKVRKVRKVRSVKEDEEERSIMSMPHLPKIPDSIEAIRARMPHPHLPDYLKRR